MKKWNHVAAVAAAVAVLALSGCGDRPEEQVGQPHQSGKVTDAESTTTAADQQPASPQGPSVDTNVMGAGPAAAAATDDTSIETQVKSALAADSDLGALKIDVDSQDGVVTLRGSAPDPIAKERAAELVKVLPNVKSVENQLTLG
jgi:hyperosmotically inducible protein